MKRVGQIIRFAASDITDFLACPYLTYLERKSLYEPIEKSPADEQAELNRRKGEAHERAYLERLKQNGCDVIDCKLPGCNEEKRSVFSKTQLEAGKAIAYQACFLHDRFFGYSDFAERVEVPSSFGSFSYELVDTKLASNPKPYFIIQLCFYSELLAVLQGTLPKHLHIVLGTGERCTYPIVDYFSYYLEIKKLFFEFVDQYPDCGSLYPSPCGHCSMCDFKDHCASQREVDDHLSLVANIRASQIEKLEAAGIKTLRRLASYDGPRIPRFPAPTLSKLQEQAALQVLARDDGEHHYRFLPQQKDNTGFYLLADRHPGDLFYDIEGDPLIEGGLEYLHGVHLTDGSYRAFWALSKEDEKKCFEDLIDFLLQHIEQNPGAHIYHYAPYEVSALKRLMCQYGTRERVVDHFLRNGILVDLYKVVRNSLIVSEPKYSIKNLEAFYMGKRDADLKSGGASVVWFEKFLETKDERLIKAIESYNRTDCEKSSAGRSKSRQFRRRRKSLFEASTWQMPKHCWKGIVWNFAPTCQKILSSTQKKTNSKRISFFL